MSLNTKPNNSSANPFGAPANAVSSFIQAPITNMKNGMMNVANSIKNTASNVGTTFSNTLNTNSMMKNLSKPLNDSLEGAVENGEMALLSIPIMITLGMLIVLFILFIVFRDQIVLGAEIVWAKIKGWFSSEEKKETPVLPETDASPVAQIEKILPVKKEVFNIADNKYTYADAEPLCKAMGAELATYDQVKEAWKKGADWCNYGWIKGQSAIYPTQQSTYDKLQSGPEDDRMACGMPGVNGGYFDNPDLRFGVNCYGVKPSQNDADIRHKMNNQESMTPDALAYDRKVQDYKAHKDEIGVNSFNSQSWSE